MKKIFVVLLVAVFVPKLVFAECVEVQVAQADSVAEYKIVISELLPEPNTGEDEFIELQNLGEESVNLKDFVLSDAATKYKLPDVVIEPDEFYVVYKAQSKIALNNSGKETVTLADKSGNILDQVVYENAPNNQSYNRGQDGEYYWSESLTPNAVNDPAGEVLGAELPRTGFGIKAFFEIILAFWYIWFATRLTFKKGQI